MSNARATMMAVLLFGPSCVAPASPAAGNKSVARMVYEEGLSRGRFDLTAPHYATDFVGHGGRNTFSQAEGIGEARGWRAAFPDLSVTVDLMVAEGDLVAVRWTAR